MASVAHLRAEITPGSILRRDPVIRQLTVDGVRLILEHGADDKPNWAFGPHVAAAAQAEPKAIADARASIPIILDATFRDAEIDFRTSSGSLLHLRLDDVTGKTPAMDTPIAVAGEGSYNNLPARVSGDIASFARLRDGAAPYGVSLKLVSGETILDFVGQTTDPLNFDGVDGRLILNGPHIGNLVMRADIPAALDSPVTLAGTASRHGDDWRLADGVGTFDGHPFSATLALHEGARRMADALTIESRFTTLDLGGIEPGGSDNSVGSIPLTIDSAPGTLVDAHLAAASVVYRRLRLQDLDVAFTLRPGMVSIDNLSAGIAGGAATSSLRVTNGKAGADVVFNAALKGVDAQTLSSLAGLGAIPVLGKLDSRVSGNLSGTTLADARDSNRIFAILAMTGGTVDRQMVRMASTDFRALFGRVGKSRLSCLGAIVDLRNGLGTIAPFILKTSDGTITGSGTYDALHDRLDVVIGSQSASTGFFALDVPMRISGPLSDYSVRPAIGASARQLRPGAALSDMPGAMRDFAQANPCLRTRR